MARQGRARQGTAGYGRHGKHKLKEFGMSKEIYNELQALEQNGMLHPSAVVEAARNVNSAMHHHFEWDDTEAARAHRENQARALIRTVKLTVNQEKPIEVRAYVSLAADRNNGAGYRRITDVMDSEFLRRQLVSEIMETSRRWERRARELGIAFSADDVVRNVAQCARIDA